MLIAFPLRRRFGGKCLSPFVLLFAGVQALRVLVLAPVQAEPNKLNRTIMPVALVDGAAAPFLTALAIYIAALSIGFVIAQRIGRSDRAAS